MKRKLSAVAAAAAALAIALTGCTGGGTPATTTGEAATLTIGMTTPPVSLDPSKAAGGFNLVYVDPAYGALLNADADGKIVAGLAEEWGYVGDDNKEFSLTLRSGLKFADGTPLTAQSVVDSISYFTTGSGPYNAYYKGLTLTAVDDVTVSVTSETPNPLIDVLMSNQAVGGDIISAAGIADPDALASGTYGAGQYVYDAAKSVANDHYVFTPNENFYDQDAIEYETITIKVIPNVSSATQALKSGQIDIMQGDATVVDTVKSTEGIEVLSVPLAWAGLYLVDRAGEVTPALADVRVRQALNFAIDRAAITTAAYGDYGTATAQAAIPGFDGYDEANEQTYTYDVDKAKSLLKEAGFEDGFTLPVNYQTFDAGSTKMVQALASQLAEVGVTLELKGDTNFGEWVSDFVSKKYSATALNATGGNYEFLNSSFSWLPTGVMNVFQVADPGMQDAYDALASASAEDSGAAAQALQKVVVDQAVTLPVSQIDSIWMYTSSLQGVSVAPGGLNVSSVLLWSTK